MWRCLILWWRKENFITESCSHKARRTASYLLYSYLSTFR